jgi:hypothetical protein
MSGEVYPVKTDRGLCFERPMKPGITLSVEKQKGVFTDFFNAICY